MMSEYDPKEMQIQAGLNKHHHATLYIQALDDDECPWVNLDLEVFFGQDHRQYGNLELTAQSLERCAAQLRKMRIDLGLKPTDTEAIRGEDQPSVDTGEKYHFYDHY